MFRIEKKGYIAPDAEIREVEGKGRGVFSKKRYERDELIERAPTFSCEVSLIEDLRVRNDGRTIFHDYVFCNKGIAHVGLGWSSVYNHSKNNNAHWKVFNEENTIEIRAKRTIEPGEEITVLYVNFDGLLWFENTENADDIQ